MYRDFFLTLDDEPRHPKRPLILIISLGLASTLLLGLIAIGAYVLITRLPPSRRPEIPLYSASVAIEERAHFESGMKDAIHKLPALPGGLARPVLSANPEQTLPGHLLAVSGSNWPPGTEIRMTWANWPSEDQVLNIDSSRYVVSVLADTGGKFEIGILAPTGNVLDQNGQALLIAYTADEQYSATQAMHVATDTTTTMPTQTADSATASPTPRATVTREITARDESNLITHPESGNGQSANSTASGSMVSLWFLLVAVIGSVLIAVGFNLWVDKVRDRIGRKRMEALETQITETQRNLGHFQLELEARFDALGDDIRLSRR